MSETFVYEDVSEQNLISSHTLYVKSLSKTFNGNRVLDKVTLMVKPGEIHGLLGQNGSGKSTLIKILSGYHRPDEGGRVWVNKSEIALPILPGKFNDYGFNFVHQDLGLIQDLTAAENLFIGQIAVSGKMFIDWKKESERAQKIFAKYSLDIDANAVVASLTSVQKAMLAIVRALEDIEPNLFVDVYGKKQGLLVLDEPTVFLPKAEVDLLFNLVRQITGQGISVLFVSHDLDEVVEVTDCFTVLRDGKYVGSRQTADIQKSDIIEMILGKELNTYHIDYNRTMYEKPVVLSAKNLSGITVDNVNFEVHEGEVLGLTGLVGSGFEEIPYLLFGDADMRYGTLGISGKNVNILHLNPQKAVAQNMALIPSDRANSGSIGDLEVSENLMMQVLYDNNPYMLNDNRLDMQSRELIVKYDVHPINEKMELEQLSGGNQQKVLLAKWLRKNPKILILHEPTQGIDVGARQQIFRLIAEAAATGTAVLCLSSDYEQLEQICNRVIVFARGKIVGELIGNEIEKEQIISLCYGNSIH